MDFECVKCLHNEVCNMWEKGLMEIMTGLGKKLSPRKTIGECSMYILNPAPVAGEVVESGLVCEYCIHDEKGTACADCDDHSAFVGKRLIEPGEK